MTEWNKTERTDATILLTGSTGQVGFELVRSLQGLGNVVALDRSGLDLSDLEQIRRVVREVKPTLIVNPAAYTAVDKAESDVETCMRLNAAAPGVLAEEAKRLGAGLVHYSTDYVFDGSKKGPYVEDDAVNPQNIYGQSKLAGEQAIAMAGCDHLIFRTSWVYGARGKNFLLTMLRLGAERDELGVVSDQFGAPTWAVTIAALSANVLAQAAVGGSDWWAQKTGIYHLTASGTTSWHGFAEAIFANSNLKTKPRVKPIPGATYPAPAIRPLNSRMSTEKLFAAFKLNPPSWDEALRLCMDASKLSDQQA